MSSTIVDRMLAGKDLDAIVAERVFGRRVVRIPTAGPLMHWTQETTGPGNVEPVPAYSTDIAAAWLLVDALHARDLALTVEAKPKALAVAWITSGMTRWAEHYAETAPLAICRAVLAAIPL